MPQLLKNNVSGVLASGINAVQTSITLVDASNFPSPTGGDFFLATLIGLNGNGQETSWEVVRCTARSTNTLTVTRAQEGTSAASWAAATTIQMRATAGTVYPIASGGTGASDAATARTNLGAASSAGGTITGNLTVNTGADSRVLLQSSGTTQGQFQTTAAEVRLASNNALPLVLSSNGVDRQSIDQNGNITFGSSTSTAKYTFVSQTTGDMIVIESVEASATAAPDVVFYRNSASPAAADQLGNILFRGKDSGAADQSYARILSTILNPTAGAETGDLRFGIQTTAGFTDLVYVAPTGLGVNVATPAAMLDVSGNQASNIVAVAALDINCAAGNFFTKTINGNSTFTVSNVPASRAYAFTLELTHTSGTVTWFSGVQWPGGTAPTLTTGKVHLFTFVTDDGGTTWRGASQVNYNS